MKTKHKKLRSESLHKLRKVSNETGHKVERPISPNNHPPSSHGGGGVVWFRRDLRVGDNGAICAACEKFEWVVGIYVIDTRWFWPVESGGEIGAGQARFLLESLAELKVSLAALGIPLFVRVSADPVAALRELVRELKMGAGSEIFFNKEYEPGQRALDARLEAETARWEVPIGVRGVKDAMLFEPFEVLTGQETFYSVFTPYKRAYLKKLEMLEGAWMPRDSVPKKRGAGREVLWEHGGGIPTAEELGFGAVELHTPAGEKAGRELLARFAREGLERYAEVRDFPAVNLARDARRSKTRGGTSLLSAHLSAGTVSIRQAMALAWGNGGGKLRYEVFAGELIWRDFYRMILFHFPHTAREAYRGEYRKLTWGNNAEWFAAWCAGRTGYPIVDAALRQLNATGFMHNRLRMIAAMFLTKDLDIDWRWGEQYFRHHLTDYDQAANVGGWQWSASTGTDAAPYFRVMNPTLQARRFDPEGEFVRHFVPELARVPTKFIFEPWQMTAAQRREFGLGGAEGYPMPMVDHAQAKARAIAKFKRK